MFMLPVKEDSHVDVENVSRLERPGVRDPVRRDVIHFKYVFFVGKYCNRLRPDVEMLFGYPLKLRGDG